MDRSLFMPCLRLQKGEVVLMIPEHKRLILQTVITAVALVLVLVYNFVHTGGLLASYVNPWWVGYVAAFGIELAVVGLSLQIGYRRLRNHTTGFFYFVLIAVVVVSALANVSQGHLERYGGELTWQNVTMIDGLQVIVGIAATALLSLIVMAMAEIVGQFMDQAQAEPSLPPQAPTLAGRVQALAQENPDWSRLQLAEYAGCSLSTVSRALNNGDHNGG
jgi:hypothetical protein